MVINKYTVFNKKIVLVQNSNRDYLTKVISLVKKFTSQHIHEKKDICFRLNFKEGDPQNQ